MSIRVLTLMDILMMLALPMSMLNILVVYITALVMIVKAKNFLHNREVRISDSGMLDYKCLNNMTVELIDLCLSNMRKGKACGPDNLCAEHLLYAHPSLVMHLKHLYVLILQHGFVPNSFGCGVGVLLVKDKMGNLNDIDNYRGITLSPIISNLFEMSRLEICNDIFSTD